jgi:myosin IX
VVIGERFSCLVQVFLLSVSLLFFFTLCELCCVWCAIHQISSESLSFVDSIKMFLFSIKVYVGALSVHYEALSVEASKQTTAEEIVSCIVERLQLKGNNYELAEVIGHCKERRLSPHEKPVSLKLLWPKHSDPHFGRFYLREKQTQEPKWLEGYGFDPLVLKEFLSQPDNREYPDLCQLPDLNESTLLENLRQRFEAGHIYTYVGSILIAVNPFRFLPIYNPKYVRLYQNQRIGPILPPHIFAIADNAYYFMLKEKSNQVS